jgi:hypothetical protein
MWERRQAFLSPPTSSSRGSGGEEAGALPPPSVGCPRRESLSPHTSGGEVGEGRLDEVEKGAEDGKDAGGIKGIEAGNGHCEGAMAIVKGQRCQDGAGWLPSSARCV